MGTYLVVLFWIFQVLIDGYIHISKLRAMIIFTGNHDIVCHLRLWARFLFKCRINVSFIVYTRSRLKSFSSHFRCETFSPGFIRTQTYKYR